MLEQGQRVQIQYAGTLENGQDFVNTWINGGPIEVTIGKNEFLPLFDQALRTLARGDRTTVRIPAEQAYGAYDPDNIVMVPKGKIPDSDNLPVGSYIALRTDMGQVRVKVASVDEDVVVLDCNHELADHDLTFEIELVRDGNETLIDRERSSTGCGCGCDKLKEQLSGNCCCEHNHDHI